MSGQGAGLVWCPMPDRSTAHSIAARLLEEGLIACANILGEMESLFVWQGACDSATETAVLFKTTATRLEAVIARLGELHPYETPAIIGWRADAALPATLEWLATTLCDRPEEA